uniref:SERTA domain-containing protein n=1 Tax=Pygocentrus nattereri TaxID=42514 RepID=A0AAR2LHY4_PYGNA
SFEKITSFNNTADEKEPKVVAILADPHPAYSLQRETVLQLSLQKLCSHVETALVRRVLITNTLRSIQQELSQQGALIMTQTHNGELLFSLHSSIPAHSDLCPTLTVAASSTPFSTSLSVAQPDLQCSSNKNGRLSFPAVEMSEKEAQIHTGSNGPCDSAHLSSSIFLPELSLDDFLFSDIDNFLCDLNPCGPNPGLAQGSSSSKVVSMVTDDLLRSLTNQPFKTDLNELDHIMEVLVGS